jgi:hypothetical protein
VPAERAELAALLDRLLQDVAAQTGALNSTTRRAEQHHPPR